MPESLLAVEDIECAYLELAVAVDNGAEILDLAVYLYAAGSLVKSHANTLDYLSRRLCILDLADAAVLQC